MPDQHILTSLEADVEKSNTVAALEDVLVKYLGRNGVINKLLQGLKKLEGEEKKKKGIELNRLKKTIEETLAQKKQELLIKEDTTNTVDVTLPGVSFPKGSLHPTTLAIEEISGIFERLGFVRASYPEVEWEWYAFESLNMPSGHPARDDIETFFIDVSAHKTLGRMLLTPHTSSGQAREMQRLGKPPVRMLNIARCYRPNWSPAHVPMFHQFEGLCIDENINITHLKGTIDHFAKEFFGPNRETRLRPFHFQFTEPSFEVDITCDICLGKGSVDGQKCKLCKSGWLELGGSGMVHPEVLKAGGLDPDKYSGWAFGFGVERTFMMKEGLKVDDLRIFYGGDVRFLEQF